MTTSGADSLGQRLRRLLDAFLPAAEATAAPTHPRAFATAMLLCEVAWADHDVSEAEAHSMHSALARLHALTEVEARATVEQARRAHAAATSVQPFTRALNDQLTREERYAVILELWRLALADEAIDKLEDYHIRKIADLLYLSHEEFIAAKRAARALSPAASGS